MFERSAQIYDAIYAFKNYEEEALRLHQWIAEGKRSPGNRLLDVGCGTGSHFPALQRYYQVEGLDLDEGLLEMARQRHPTVQLHHASMVDFDLPQRFDVITCLFSAIGYVVTLDRLEQTLANFRRHLAPGGLVVVEPWLAPESFTPGRLHSIFVDQPELKIARMNISALQGRVSLIDFHYLVGRPDGIETFTEHHELGLFTPDEYLQSFERAGLEIELEPVGLTGRGLYFGSCKKPRQRPGSIRR